MGCNPLPRHETQANYNYQAELGKFYCFMTGRKLRNCTIQEICSQRSQLGFEVTKTIKQKQRVNIGVRLDSLFLLTANVGGQCKYVPRTTD